MKNRYIIKGNTAFICLQKGMMAQIDIADLGLVKKYHWYAHRDYANHYVRASIGKKKILLHRYLMSPQKDKQIDHIDGDGLNNRRTNLKIVTNQQNHFNRRKHKFGTSQYKGVYYEICRGKWKAQIGFNGKRIHIGRFDTELAAALAFNKKALELFGADFAHLNDVSIQTVAA